MVDDFSFNIYRTSYDICMEVCFFKEAMAIMVVLIFITMDIKYDDACVLLKAICYLFFNL